MRVYEVRRKKSSTTLRKVLQHFLKFVELVIVVLGMSPATTGTRLHALTRSILEKSVVCFKATVGSQMCNKW